MKRETRKKWERSDFEALGSPDVCWPWPHAKSTRGYGRLNHDGRLQQAHRVSYEMIRGPIPAGLQLDHLCRNRACVNPAHLEPVTARENTLRGAGVTAAHARKTHCKNGHEFTEENTLTYVPGERRCRVCALATVSRCKAKKRALDGCDIRELP